MKLLLIEDNQRLAERIAYHLGKNFTIDVASTGSEGKTKARSGDYSVILLDLYLPDAYGGDICRDLRDAKVDTPILVISGIKEADTRIALLNCGADDYLVKPFDPRELTARIHAIFRRHHQGYNQHILTVKDLVIDINRRQVQRQGIPITLRRKEFDILEYLVANRGRTVTRNMILDHVWDNAKESWHNTVDVHIKHLRDKVDRPFGSPLIKTAYGIGYMVDDTAT